MWRPAFFLLLLLLPLLAAAQAVPDTMATRPVPDSLAQRKAAEARAIDSLQPAPATASAAQPKALFTPNPKRSGMYSAIVPGMGQIYNRQYWKAPIIYAGFAVCGYFLVDNNRQYTKYRTAYIRRTDGDPTTRDDYENLYSVANLQDLRDGYKRYLDITVLITAAGYALQVIDAVTFAHLYRFDVSPNISLQAQPVLGPGYAGVGLVMRW